MLARLYIEPQCGIWVFGATTVPASPAKTDSDATASIEVHSIEVPPLAVGTRSPCAVVAADTHGRSLVLAQKPVLDRLILRTTPKPSCHNLGPSCDPVCSDWTHCVPPTVLSQASLATQPEILTVFTALASWRCPSGPLQNLHQMTPLPACGLSPT